MPTYTILGGTGKTGNELINLLADEPRVILHVYVRSRARLIESHPHLDATTSRHKIYTGDLDDIDLFTECLSGSDAIFCAVGSNSNNPQLRLAQDVAHMIIATIERLRQSHDSSLSPFAPPTVLFLTSVGMASNPRTRSNFPTPLHWVLGKVFNYIYADFDKATALFRRTANQDVSVIFICAPGLTIGSSQGEVYIDTMVPANAPRFVTYVDLAKAMVRAEVEKSRWTGHEVGIIGAKMPRVAYGTTIFYFSTGWLCAYVPPLWRLGHRRGWWGS